MSITPSSPIPRAAIANWKLDTIGLKIYDRRIVLVYGAYDALGNRIDERQIIITDFTVPSVADFLAACPAAPNLRRQAEQFGATADPADLSGTVD